MNEVVFIEASRIEFGLHRDEHRELDEVLETAGFRVHRTQPVERRGAPDGLIDAIALVVRIAVDGVEIAERIEPLVRRVLRRRGKRTRTVRIVDSRGDTLREVVVPVEDQASAT